MTEQFDFENIIRRVVRQWYYIVMISLTMALLVGIVTSRLYRPSYETQAMIAVYGKDYYNGVVQKAEDTSKLFQEVITSSILQKRVAEVLGLSSLPGTVSCSNVPKTNMIILKVSASNPENAMLVMNGILDNYSIVTEKLLNDMVLQVLEDPKVPISAVQSYNEKKMMMAAFLVSAAGLIMLLCLYYYFRDDIKNEYQVEKKLDTKLFATIYHEDREKGIRLQKKKKRKAGLLVTNPVTSFGYTETFKKMCTRLEYQTQKKEYKSILLTSVQENEGKSTIAANLALTLASVGKKVLLVDLDLRKPAQFKLFEIPYGEREPQVGDVLMENANINSAVKEIGKSNLLLLAGNRSYRNSTRMLSREITANIVEAMKDGVDYVILDTPPMSMVADAEEVMRYADAGLLVVRQNGAKTKDINDVIDVFKSAGCRLLGCVYNDVKIGLWGNTWFQNDGYNYQYGYGKKYYDKKGK